MLSYIWKALLLSYFLIVLAPLPCVYQGLPESPINSFGLYKVLQSRTTGSRLFLWLSALREAGGDSGTLTTTPLLYEITAGIRNHI